MVKPLSTHSEAFFGTAFDDGPTERMAESYITSFCTHAPGSYESENGLLSQWRAYGGANARFCLVLDTAETVVQLKKEWDSFNYFYGKLIDVVYHVPAVSIDEFFPDLIAFYVEHLATGIMKAMKHPSSEMIVEFIAAATRFKHQGFREEQEARIILIPMPRGVLEIARAQNTPGSQKAEKLIRSRTREGVEVPYASLFEADAERLPIKRIIVGPAQDQDARFAEARRSIRGRYRLSRSETPFIR